MKQKIKKTNTSSGVESSHPSYGAIRFNNIMGTTDTLYGTTVTQDGFVRLTITRAKSVRMYHEEHSYETSRGDEVVVVDMSPHQFAELLISSGSRAEGVPCTIKRLNGKKIEPVQVESTMDKFKLEYSEIMDTVKKAINGISERFSDATNTKGIIKKADVAKMKEDVDWAINDFNDALPFFFSMFEEQIEKTLNEMKHNIVAFNDLQIRSDGLSKWVEYKRPDVSVQTGAFVGKPENQSKLPVIIKDKEGENE